MSDLDAEVASQSLRQPFLDQKAESKKVVARSLTRICIGAVAAGSSMVLQSYGSFADSSQWRTGDVVVEQAWARIIPGGAKTGAAYLTVHNLSSDFEYLAAVETTAATGAAIYENRRDNGEEESVPVPGGLNISAHGEVTMKPSGFHVKLSGLTGALKPGSKLPLTLYFVNAGKLEMEVPVLPSNAKAPSRVHLGHGS